MIYEIGTLELHTYAAFCRWLRNSQGTKIGDLIKETEDIQYQKLMEFISLSDRQTE